MKFKIFTTLINTLTINIYNVVILLLSLNSLGTEEVNVWFLISFLFAFSNIMHLGFNNILSRFISYSDSGIRFKNFPNIIKGNIIKENPCSNELFFLVNKIKKIYFALTLILIIFNLIIGYFVLNKPINLLNEAWIGWKSFIIFLIINPIIFYLHINRIYLYGLNKITVINKINISSYFIAFLFIIVLYQFYDGLFFLCIALFLGPLLNVISLSKVSGINKLEYGKIEKKYQNLISNEIFSSAFKMSITNTNALLIKYIPVFFAPQFFQPNITAPFFLARKIFDFFDNISNVPMNARFTQLIHTYNSNKVSLLNFFKKTQRLQFFIISFMIIALFTVGEAVYGFFKFELGYPDPRTLMFFSFILLISRWCASHLSLCNICNNIVDHKFSIIVILFNGILIFLIPKSFGINLFLLANLGGLIFGIILILFKAAKSTYNINLISYEKDGFVTFFVFIVLINIIFYHFNI